MINSRLHKALSITGITIVVALAGCASDPVPASPVTHAPPVAISETGPCCGPITPAAKRILHVLDTSNVEQLWAKHRHIDWETGVPDAPDHYQGRDAATHCSAFAAAMGWRLGVYMLRPPEHPQQLLANAQTAWFGSAQGRDAGWYPLDSPEQAQVIANQGKLVVVAYPSPQPHRAGHIGIVRPSLRTEAQIQESGVEMTQSGDHNALRISEKTAFRSHPDAWPNHVRYFAHDLPESSAPDAVLTR
jgi:hypothetical protein